MNRFPRAVTEMGNEADVVGLRFSRLSEAVSRLVWSKRLDVLKPTPIKKGGALVATWRVGMIAGDLLVKKEQNNEPS